MTVPFCHKNNKYIEDIGSYMGLEIGEIKIYLISLEWSEKRRAQMVENLAGLGLDYTWFHAVDGAKNWNSLVSTVDMKAFERKTGRNVLKGEIGAYHSHLGVWDAFIKTGKNVALVLEDDVVFHPDFLTALQVALAAVDRWDFLKLNKIRAKHPIYQGSLGPYTLNAYLGAATGLGAYLITSQTAQMLRPRMLPITRPIDHELDRVFHHPFRHLGLEPFPSHVDDNKESTITGTDFAKVKKFPKWRRLPVYVLRARNLIGKALVIALQRHGYLLPRNAHKID
jgi:glycosyl transferase family 25